MIIKRGRQCFWNHETRKGLWAFFLDCAVRELIGWAGKLRSRGRTRRPRYLHRKVCSQHSGWQERQQTGQIWTVRLADYIPPCEPRVREGQGMAVTCGEWGMVFTCTYLNDSHKCGLHHENPFRENRDGMSQSGNLRRNACVRLPAQWTYMYCTCTWFLFIL